MSDVPRARIILEQLMAAPDVPPSAKRQIGRALALMVRVKSCRKAPGKRQVIDREMRQRVRALVRTTDLTMHEIANRVGLRRGGSISEIMHGKR